MSRLTKEQAEVLRCAARWIWHGAQRVGHAKGDPFRYWERRLTHAAVKMLNASCERQDLRVTRETLRRMLDAIDAASPGDARKETDR